MTRPLRTSTSSCCLAGLLLIGLLPACGNRQQAGILQIGESVPPFSAVDLKGRPVSLEAFQGRPVILRFFLTDCRFCTADTPVFNTLFKNYQQDGLQIVYINDNAADSAKVRAFADSLGIAFPVVFDPEAKIAKLYERARCLVCGMFVARHPNWICQVRHSDETVQVFDGIKDLMAYYFNPARDGTSAAASIAEIWVRDYYTLTWLDGRQVFFVIGSDILGPMGHELIAFSSQEAARSFLKDHHGTRVLSFPEITSTLVETLKTDGHGKSH